MIESKLPLKFILILLLLSIPFWLLGFIGPDTSIILAIKLPISALMTFCPLLAAAILVYKESHTPGVKELLKLSFDFKKIKNKKWLIPIVFLMPTLTALSYGYLKLIGVIRPEPVMTILTVVLFFFVYFIAAIGEEVGWSGYLIDPLQSRYGALKASIIVGLVWAIWHIIPYYQMHRTTEWIMWQCIGTIFLRIIMVWIFNNAGKSVFAMVLFHTMINISPYLIPNYNSYYEPLIFTILLFIIAIGITYLSGAKTLAEYKFSFVQKKNADLK